MSKDTIKILVAVLRVFVAAVSKGNPIALHEYEIVNQVCRALHKRKEKEIKNTKGMVVFAVRSFKGCKILYEAVDSWADDKLNRPKAAAVKRAFGLTDRAIKYVEDRKILGAPITSDQFLLDMLRDDEFGALPKEKVITHVDAAPAALAAAISEIKQEQPIQTVETEPTPMLANNNAARLASEIKNLPYKSEFFNPGALLGALYDAKAFSPDTAIAAGKIKWPAHRVLRVRDDLVRRGLIAWRDVCDIEFEKRSPAKKHSGIFLTQLGREVAAIGNFEYESPDNRPNYRQKRGSMLKGSKKPQKPVDPKSLAMSNEEISRVMTALTSVLAARGVEWQPGATETKPATRSAAVTVVAPKMVDDYETIAVLLRDFTNTLCRSIAALETLNGSNSVNVDGVSMALTEIHRVIVGFKHHINKCLKGQKTLNVKHLQDYAAQMELDLEHLSEHREIPVLEEIDTDIGVGRVLKGSRAITRSVWTPS